MSKFAYLDSYAYGYEYKKGKVVAINLYLDSYADVASVSTDITSHGNLVYLEGHKYIQQKQELTKRNGLNILTITVKDY